MSRIGKLPVTVPSGVQVTIDGRSVSVKGPKGELKYRLTSRVQVEVVDGLIVVTTRDNDRESRALHGLTRSLLANMVQGVSEGYQKALEIHGTGYRAAKSGSKLVLSVGYSHSVEIAPPDGIEIEVSASNAIVIKGADKQQVGQVAANIRSVRKAEPYLGKGIKYAGERIRRKAGKAGKTGK